jgi:hypothetical protein
VPAAATNLPPLRATRSDGFLLGLESLMRRSGQGRHLAATVIECEGVPDLAAIRRTAECLGRKYPVLHARLVRGADFIARWRLDEVSPAAVPVHAWRLRGVAGEGEEIESVFGLAARCINGREIDIREAGPNLHLHVIATEAARWTLLLVWSHSLHDAVGIDKLLHEISAIADRPDDFVPESGGLDFPPAAESMGSLYKRAEPMMREMRTFPAWGIRSLNRKGVKPGECRFLVRSFDREETAVIRAKMAATSGELLLLPYFACCASRAVRSVIAARHPDERVAILLSLPAQRHGDAWKRPLFQNHMTVFTLLLTPDELEELKPAVRALYKKYADFMRRKLTGAMDALMQMMERCPSRFYNLPAFHYLNGEVCSLFHSHTGNFAPSLDALFGSRVANGYHVPSVCAPPGIGIFFSEYAGQLTMTVSWKEGCLSPLELELVKQTLSEDLGAPVP